ncbi:hypothetical protein C0Q70_00237 [Pomacea canaliculata]|uniref:DNA excision repair protein ERCC-6 n=1 Tax=Pomacea canaliculata TaxID=400727 RepID=A0A2T7PW65_POMCA|nr:hypothetical protein C0Q70_00237 [Pomacea canaliculata]
MDSKPQQGITKSSEKHKMDNDDHGNELSEMADKDGLFKVDTGLIPQALLGDQASELVGLGLSVFNQDEFEEGVMKQVDQAMAKEELERLKRILQKELKSIEEDMKLVESDLEHISKAEMTVEQQNATAREIHHRQQAIRKQKETRRSHLKTLQVRQKMALAKMKNIEEAERGDPDIEEEEQGSADHPFCGLNGQPQKESARDRMIRLGEMTPFGTVLHGATAKGESSGSKLSAFEQFLLDKQKNFRIKDKKPLKKNSLSSSQHRHHSKKSSDKASSSSSSTQPFSIFHKKDKKANIEQVDNVQKVFQRKRSYPVAPDLSEDGEIRDENCDKDKQILENSDSDYEPECTDNDDSEGEKRQRKVRGKQLLKKTNAVYRPSDDEDEPVSKRKPDRSIAREKDDADENYYQRRLRIQQQRKEQDDSGDEEFEGGLIVPGKLWKKLYKYQKTGVRWLWELHMQQAGGIIGDEMGLGKTIQMIAFLAAMKESRLHSKDFPYVGLGPVVIVCPTTVMHQWVREFHTWWPDFRVAILHSSGSYTGSEAQLVRNIVKSNGVLVTSFNTLVIQQDILLPYNWHYIVLDEGHKIRNPDAQITLCCKQFRTPHRLILSGSPIQNNLKELWSLFDFVFPGKLGTLPDFMAHFSIPIVQGGYANATQVQILFCRLTDEQREVYKEYLDSRECHAILAGKFQMLDIIESFIQERNYTYLRMDGSTSISSRQPLVLQYNKDPSIYIFLLTTRVGGLGVNLTGANRVIIYDPDWNPSTDMQARERAWRIGQTRQVTIYRLLTSGTIEEKIYHRQIFKQFLTNRVLKDPKQRRFFKSNDIYELFTLGEKDEHRTETSAIFAGTGSDVKMPRRLAVPPIPTPKLLKPNRFDEMKKQSKLEDDFYTSSLDNSEVEKMRELARKLSRKMEEEKLQKLKSTEIGTQSHPDSSATSEQFVGSARKTRREESSLLSSRHPFGKDCKKRKKDAKFEGQRIPHLVKSCEYKSQAANEQGQEDALSKHQDDYVLRRLFKKTGIQAVMKHDKIVDSSHADYALVEAEATKVAREAVAALRRSRAMCMPAVSGVPTWTGQHGGPLSKPRFGQKKNGQLVPKAEETTKPSANPTKPAGELSSKKSLDKSSLFDGSQAGGILLGAEQEAMSSSELLTCMHKRKQFGAQPDASMDNMPSSSISRDDQELLEDLRNFIAFMSDINGQATTHELLTNFGPRLPPSDSAKFKAMLVQICNFNKVDGLGIWRLKQEFR